MKHFGYSKQIWSWALYDFANSAFATTVIAGFFPVFFKEYWSLGTDSVLTTARLGSITSTGSLIIAVMSPFIGAIADLRANKKLFTFIFMLLGAFATMSLGFFDQGQWFPAAICFGIGMIGFNSSSTFYDSLLPSIAPGDSATSVSSLGFSIGYLGGGLLFAVNVLMYLKPEFFGFANGVAAIKFSFLSVGVWWILFSIPLFLYVPEPKIEGPVQGWAEAFGNSFSQLKHTISDIVKNKNLLFFLVAYWFYIDGVFTTINMAVDFGISLGFKSADLIAALLLVQFVGFPFALLFSKLANKLGSKGPILFCLIIYVLTIYFASRMTEVWHFFALAFMIGTVQGGVQALSRSLFSKMCPAEKSGEYFGFFNLIGKFASILGPLLVGFGTLYFGDHRIGLLGNIILLVIGGALLTKVIEPHEQAR